MACISPCPTGSIDNWRTMPKARAYTIEEQLTLGRAAGRADAGAARGRRRRGRDDAPPRPQPVLAVAPDAAAGEAPFNSAAYGATVPPWSAAHAVHQPLRPEEPDHRDRGRQRQRAPRPASRTRRTTSCSTSARCRSRCSKASRSASCRPASTRSGRPHDRAPVLGRQPAQRRAAGLQQRLADGEARARGPPGQAGARRRVELPVRPRRSATRCR